VLIYLLYFAMLHQVLRSPFFPYSTLFRSVPGTTDRQPDHRAPGLPLCAVVWLNFQLHPAIQGWHFQLTAQCSINDTDGHIAIQRSEEHTSELQSRENIVCRLLLEKKNHQL